MLPSLVADELRTSLTSFLGTTFALADDDVRAELERFIADDAQGVFRGPYVRLRLPFRPAAAGWQDLLDFVPRDFTPHRHQAQAWERLSSLHHTPEPTLVTTGTGSGKTEGFLVPLLDHCQRHHRVRGVKALVLYPMNALANDQARRIAAMVHNHSAQLGGVRVGLYTGDSPDASGMTEGGVIGNRHELRKNPPDILLTNYKMLDMLLLRSEDSPLFEGAGESLRYLVLDEFHTYDGPKEPTLRCSCAASACRSELPASTDHSQASHPSRPPRPSAAGRAMPLLCARSPRLCLGPRSERTRWLVKID